jgi:creatinine amidohydrolase
LGANVLIADHVARAVSQRLGILRYPTFCYGVLIGGGPFAGTTGLRRNTLHRSINELRAHREDGGVSEFVIITAHRYEPHLEALLMALTDAPTNSVYDLYQINIRSLLESDPESEHGGELETSLVLHLAPELVHMYEVDDFVPGAEELRRYTRGRVPAPPPESRGVVGRPKLGTPEKRAAIFERYTQEIAAALEGRPTNDANAWRAPG